MDQPASPDQPRLMLQRVLARRFQFSFTVNDAMQPVDALVVAPRGLKVKPWTSGADCTSAVIAIGAKAVPTLPRPILASFATCSIPDLLKRFNRPWGTIDGLPVVNTTGLAGLYPMWVWRGKVPSGPGRFRPGRFQEAVQRELGLELVKATAPYRVLHAKTIARLAGN